ncbi:two-component system sensor histidine kinase NtrB [Sphingomonas turrisvirgatae]|uniref:histidine kinase n=1 Tax=Sphingomonas turrisvirgatae TaxID=1888892 RepID=A0A1E3LQX4_9SPHN|nr:ATP-binding protein [Sphingomonas turrisvirgatae]ODP36172.1 two-component sensor histidine kinase [Sphingomonas turrisvirgatae]
MATSRSGLRPPPQSGEPDLGELFSGLPVAAIVLDPQDRVVRANMACEHLLNHSERAMRGQRLDRIVTPPPGYAPRRDGHGFAAYDVEIEPNRSPRTRVDFVEAPIAEHPGWRIVTLHQAPTSRRLSVGADRSAGARAAVGAAAMLAHEIKNPLSGIRGAAQLLAGDDDAEGRSELTQLITDEVDRIAALIDRMQDFTDTRPPKLAPHNIYPLLDHSRRVALAGFARGITIEERFDPSLPPVMMDKDAFQQVVMNLLKNAAEAVRGLPEPRIVLATQYRHGFAMRPSPDQPRRSVPIEVSVSDNGPGAPADIASHLFEPFVSGKPEGKGLGLPLVEKLVRDMGGVVEYARAGDPEMTVFRVNLPRADL